VSAVLCCNDAEMHLYCKLCVVCDIDMLCVASVVSCYPLLVPGQDSVCAVLVVSSVVLCVNITNCT
jgi:hypothetical protein